MELIERASRYLAKMEASVSGSGGHNAAFAAAVAMVKGFSLPEDVAFGLLWNDFNPRCSPAWSERELRHKIRQASKASNEEGYLLGNDRRKVTVEDWKKRQQAVNGAIQAEPVKKGQEVDWNAVLLLGGSEQVDEAFIESRSPINVQALEGPEDFLGALYEEGEKVLVFANEASQGDFGFLIKKGSEAPGRAYRLGDRPSVKSRPDVLPRSGRLGVWMLANPVCGDWKPNGTVDRNGRPMLSRRSGPNVTSWRYLLLESDDLPPEQWMRIVAHLPLPIAAIYTSGSRSVHVLVRIDARTQDELRAAAEVIGPVMAKLGGDWKAMSSVRLTRLPLCYREGKMAKADGGKRYEKFARPVLQRLLWLDPDPECLAIAARPVLRHLTENPQNGNQ